MSTHTTCAVLSAVNTAADTAHFVYRLHWSPLWVEKSALACYVNLIVDLMCFLEISTKLDVYSYRRYHKCASCINGYFEGVVGQ